MAGRTISAASSLREDMAKSIAA
ncbi:protein of unknown function [Methylorubrum extorquens]|uniref:Uncharacterized protein n=1 Tax=Methylorubrum extorquens TaxID=408 RepID=A0A2N9AHX8_METEX|nr:protein of unknown function [Methylorubrum extorquens]